MKSIRIALHHSPETIGPTHELVCESPAIHREVLLEGRSDGETETVVSYVEGDREAYETALAGGDVEAFDVTPDGDDAFYVYVRQRLRGDDRLLADALRQETIVLVPPVEFLPDRTMRLTLIGRGEDLGAAVDAMPDGVDVEVLEVGEYARGLGRRLTDRQREAVRAAWAVGYYEVPRGGGIEAVAGRLDCAVSTASDLLRRAESRLVAAAIGERRQ